ncbi:polysaccharide pyruvyl transferase family protein [Sphingobacterium sp. DN00404]|uniref:Polysaccharide pyruvyl transferase family protein n=1 Tax=Sphingobacterium micropteri TaxID=2763501 RepID=A0ABR7YKG3_9SPHI|nr:polysaccharide pyruvyl transferase family protein [Sphingobacterium micropteri]MBD1431816.1 polysaccharide pyruvyl transferase family protein [Sphingobacterium micropteri]
MRKKAIFIVATQYDNVGDLLINKCLIYELSNYVDLYLDTRNVPDEFKEKLLESTTNVFLLEDLTKYSFKGIGAILFFFSNVRIDYIFKSPGPFGSGGNKNVFLKNLFFGFIYSLFRLKKVRSYLIGNDIQTQHWLDRFWLRIFSGNIERILSRSSKNVNSLQNLGIKNVGYVPDMCFGLRTNDVRLFAERQKIGISFRDLNSSENHLNIEESIDMMVNFWLKEGYEIIFFYQVDRDREYNQRLYERYNSTEGVSFRDGCLLWNDIDVYQNFAMLLSNRLHVILLGLVFGAIPLGVLDDNLKTKKIHEIFETIGLDSLLFQRVMLANLEFIQNNMYNINLETMAVSITQRKLLKDSIANLFGN